MYTIGPGPYSKEMFYLLKETKAVFSYYYAERSNGNFVLIKDYVYVHKIINEQVWTRATPQTKVYTLHLKNFSIDGFDYMKTHRNITIHSGDAPWNSLLFKLMVVTE